MQLNKKKNEMLYFVRNISSRKENRIKLQNLNVQEVRSCCYGKTLRLDVIIMHSLTDEAHRSPTRSGNPGETITVLL